MPGHGRFDVLANVILITPPEHAAKILEQFVPGADDAGCMAGASAKAMGMTRLQERGWLASAP